jgi:hypothetical protein
MKDDWKQVYSEDKHHPRCMLNGPYRIEKPESPLALEIRFLKRRREKRLKEIRCSRNLHSVSF